jgi:50S ribosomal subunit-associated GTPase HflX
LHVVDASTPQALGQAEVVLDELETLGAAAPMLTAFNKVDLLAPEERVERLAALWDRFPNGVAVSARSGEGLDLLASRAAAAVVRTADTLADSVTHPGHAFGRGEEWEGPL